MALLAVEIGFRLYYHLTDTPLFEIYEYSEEGWRHWWIERHRGRDHGQFEGSDEYHPKFGWKPRPNLRKARIGMGVPVTTNSRGWRNLRDFPFDKPPGVRRIVAVGDSFTFGEEEEDEYTWPAVLQDALSGWEVINLAVHGYGTDQQLLVLQDEGVRYHPDVVLVGFFADNCFRNVVRFRDYAKPRFVLEGERLSLTNVPVPEPDAVLREPAPPTPVSYAWLRVSQLLCPPWGLSRRTQIRDEMPRLTRAILAEMKATCDRCGARMLLVFIPELGNLGADREMVLEWAPSLGYETLDLRKALSETRQRGGKLARILHLSRLGNAVAAQAVLDRLVELGWVRPEAVTGRERLARRCVVVPGRDGDD